MVALPKRRGSVLLIATAATVNRIYPNNSETPSQTRYNAHSKPQARQRGKLYQPHTTRPTRAKKRPGIAPGHCVYLLCFSISPNRTRGKKIRHITTINIWIPPIYANVKRFVSVVLVYCVAISGCAFFNAAVSMRLLVTALYMALCSVPVKVSFPVSCI